MRGTLDICMSRSTPCPRRFGEESKSKLTLHLGAKNWLLLQLIFLPRQGPHMVYLQMLFFGSIVAVKKEQGN